MLLFQHSSLPIYLRRTRSKEQGFKKAFISVLCGSLGCFSKGLCSPVYFRVTNRASNHGDARRSLKYSNVILCITHKV